MDRVKKGIFVIIGCFTSTVADEQRSHSVRIEFWDGDELFDYIIFYSKRGSNTEKNIQILCEKSNKKKPNTVE